MNLYKNYTYYKTNLLPLLRETVAVEASGSRSSAFFNNKSKLSIVYPPQILGSIKRY